MDCASARECLSQQLDGELSPDHETALRAHLAQCEECRAAAGQFSRLDAQLRALVPDRPAALRVAEKAVQGTHSTFRIEPSSRASRGWSALVTTMAALAICMLVLIGLPRPKFGAPIAVPTNRVRITLARGAVDVLAPAADEWQPVSLPADALQPSGARLRTAAKGLCEFVCPTGGVVRVDEQTEVTFSNASEVSVAHGRVWCEAAPGSTLKVLASLPAESTGMMSMTCQPTSVMQAHVSPKQSIQIFAAAGPVHVATDAAPVTLRTGNRIVYSSAGFMDQAPGDALHETEWMLPLLALRGGHDSEFARHVTGLLATLGRTKLDYMREQRLVELGGPAAIPLVAFLKEPPQSSDAAKRQIAARIIRETAPAESLPDLVDLLEDDVPEVRISAAGALERLTGRNQGLSSEEWRELGERQRAAVGQWRVWLRGR